MSTKPTEEVLEDCGSIASTCSPCDEECCSSDECACGGLTWGVRIV